MPHRWSHGFRERLQCSWGEDQGQIVGGRGEGLCRPYMAEGSVKGVSVLQHRRERREGAEGEIWVREPKVARYA